MDLDIQYQCDTRLNFYKQIAFLKTKEEREAMWAYANYSRY